MITVALIPTRQRVDGFAAAAQSVFDTSDALVVGVVDHNDPDLKRYLWMNSDRIMVIEHPGSGNVNEAIEYAWRQIEFDQMMVMGDDLRCRTRGWDSIIAKYFEKDPMLLLGIYDVRVRKKLEHFAFTRQWAQTVGFVVPKHFEHFCADECVEKIATAAGKLRFVDEIRVEHLHPKYGKGKWDDVYMSKRNNGSNDRDRKRLDAMAPEILKLAERVRLYEHIPSI